MSNPMPYQATLHIRDHCLCLHAQRAARMLARLAELDATDLAVAGAVTRSMGLTGPEGHRLRHGLVGAALGVVQSSHQRRDLHLRAARMLRDAGAPSDRIAAHLLTAGGAAPAWTVEALRDAAGTAVRRGESWTAVRYLRHALLAGPDEPGRAAVLAVRVHGSPAWRQAIELRDRLRADATARAGYAAHKRAAAERHADDPDPRDYRACMAEWRSDPNG